MKNILVVLKGGISVDQNISGRILNPVLLCLKSTAESPIMGGHPQRPKW
jgi:hypothetical protein